MMNTSIYRFKSTLSSDQRDLIANGPSLDDFVSGNAPSSPEELKRKKRQRLPLPVWLRTEVPKGKNFHRLKEDLRRLKLHTVRY